MDIESRLDMSLDDLIKMKSQKEGRKGARGGDRKGDGDTSGSRRARRGQGARGGRVRADEMDVDHDDPAPRQRAKVDMSALKAKGGVMKGRGSARGGKAPGFSRQQVEPVDLTVPKGNINGKWKHDLHDDEGPARPRISKAAARAEHRAPNVLRRLRVSNLGPQVDEADLRELFEMEGEVQSVDLVQRGSRNEATVDFAFEEGALRAKERYSNVKLDGLELKLHIVAIDPAERRLASGIVVSRAGGQGGGVRGRGGVAGRLRSDVDEDMGF